MRVRYLVASVGPGVNFVPGDEDTTSDKEGKRLCEAGTCVPVVKTKRKATIKPTEKR